LRLSNTHVSATVYRFLSSSRETLALKFTWLRYARCEDENVTKGCFTLLLFVLTFRWMAKMF
jgi:hypothetical protein